MPVRPAIWAQAWIAQPRILAFLRAGAQQAPGVDVRRETLVVDEDALAAQHVGDEVVGEDRERVEVRELGDPAEREVARRDLGALVEARVLPHGHAAGEQLGHPDGRAAGLGDDVEGVARAEEAPELAQGLREEGHELVVAVLAEGVGDLLGAQLAQLRRAPAGAGAPAVGERPRDGEVARGARALADGRKPPRAEVDRVED